MRNHVAKMTDADAVRFQHSFNFTVDDDGLLHSLAERDAGYFTVADDPVGSDRTVRTIELRLDPLLNAAGTTVYIGGPQGATYLLQLGESYGSEAAFLSQTWLLRTAGAGDAIVTVFFKAMDE